MRELGTSAPLALFLLLASLPTVFSALRRPSLPSTSDLFPGWRGEVVTNSKQAKQGRQNRLLGAAALPEIPPQLASEERARWDGEVRTLLWRPRAFLFKNFLTDEEADYLRQKAEPHLQVSTVVDTATGESSVDQSVRTSTGTFFDRDQGDEVIDRVQNRIAAATHIPVTHGEGLQVLRYDDTGQEYRPHHDFFSDKFNTRKERGGQRLASVIMYLSTAEEGGETVFPGVVTNYTGQPAGHWSACARTGFAVKTLKRDALFFYGLTPDGKEDPYSLHGSCPTTKGVKWSCTKWLHVHPYPTQ